MHRLARTIDGWRPELLAYFDTHRGDERADQED
jgi:hypothetical protein